jgi:hypothetical protein
VDAVILVPTVVLSLALLSIYAAKCMRRTHDWSLSVAVSLVLLSSGAVGGALLMARPFLSAAFQDRLTGLDLYIWIGGLAVFAVSALEIFRAVLRRRPPR